MLVLESKRLVIREYQPDDLHARHQTGVECFESTDTLDDTQKWLTWTIGSYREFDRLGQPRYGDYAVALKDTGEVIGSIGLVPSVVAWGVFETPPHFRLSPEFGLYWATLPAYQKQGYALEAAQRFIPYVREHRNPVRIIATTDHDKFASQRVMEKLGMEILRNPYDEPFWFEVVGILTFND